MNTNDGRIYTPEEMEKINDTFLKDIVEMKTSPTEKQMARKPPRVKGYERCPCDSGKQFKNCCKKKKEE